MAAREQLLSWQGPVLTTVSDMDEPERAPTAFSSRRPRRPVDRTELAALEARVGTDRAFATCFVGEGALAVFAEPGREPGEHTVVIQEHVGHHWIEIGRFDTWPDAYRMLGELVDDASERVPVDQIDRPSPTILIAGDRGCVEILYRTAEGVRVAREFDERFEPQFEVYEPLWEDFITATDDEATDDEYAG